MITLEDLQREMEPYKGTLVIDIDSVVLLKDVVREEDDLYWVYYGNISGGYKKYLSSCVMNWIPLKGFIPEKDYQRLVSIWNLNNIEEWHAQ